MSTISTSSTSRSARKRAAACQIQSAPSPSTTINASGAVPRPRRRASQYSRHQNAAAASSPAQTLCGPSVWPTRPLSGSVQVPGPNGATTPTFISCQSPAVCTITPSVATTSCAGAPSGGGGSWPACAWVMAACCSASATWPIPSVMRRTASLGTSTRSVSARSAAAEAEALVERRDALLARRTVPIRPPERVLPHEPLEVAGAGVLHEAHRLLTARARRWGRQRGRRQRCHRVFHDWPEHLPAERLELLLHPVQVGPHQRGPCRPQRADKPRAEFLYNRIGQKNAVHRDPPRALRALPRPCPLGGTLFSRPPATQRRPPSRLTIVGRTRRA